MIPLFPRFQSLNEVDRAEYEARVARFEPHSPFNFVCLSTWNQDGATAVSSLSENLIVRQIDYQDGKPYLGFLGDSEPAQTAAVLLDWAPAAGLPAVLRWIPEEAVAALVAEGGDAFTVRGDEANHDYVYELEQLVALRGRRYERRRQGISAFRRKFGELELRRVSADCPRVVDEIEGVVARWWEARWQHEADSARAAELGARRDLAALRRCLGLERACGLAILGAFLADEMIGFSIFERVREDMVLGHYQRALPRFAGLSDILLHASAKVMLSSGAQSLNFQEDLGHDGLRAWKRAWQPVRYLRKFDVWRAR